MLIYVDDVECYNKFWSNIDVELCYMLRIFRWHVGLPILRGWAPRWQLKWQKPCRWTGSEVWELPASISSPAISPPWRKFLDFSFVVDDDDADDDEDDDDFAGFWDVMLISIVNHHLLICLPIPTFAHLRKWPKCHEFPHGSPGGSPSKVRGMLSNMEEWSCSSEIATCFRNFTGGSQISKQQLLQLLNKLLPGSVRRRP